MRASRMNESGRRRRRPEERRQIVCDCLRSGKSVWRFSQSIEVGYGSLCKWIKRYTGDAGDFGQKQLNVLATPTGEPPG